jgi:hypothetical protein
MNPLIIVLRFWLCSKIEVILFSNPIATRPMSETLLQGSASGRRAERGFSIGRARLSSPFLP